MLVGPHLSNGPPTEADYAALALLRPTAVSTMAIHHGLEVYEYIEGLCRPLYIVRAEPSIEGIVAAVRSVPEPIRREKRAKFRLGNEPNNPKEPGRMGPAEYARLFLGIKATLDEPLIVANLWLGGAWREYLVAIRAAVEVSDGLALSLYRDDASDPGRWLDAYAGFGKPLYCCELNVDYVPKGRLRVDWWRWVIEDPLAPHLAAGTIYILGGEPGLNSEGKENWPRHYIMDGEEIEGLATLVREQGEASMGKAVAIIPSNQQRNVSSVPGYSQYNEYGGMMHVANLLRSEYRALGLVAEVFDPGSEIFDSSGTHLFVQRAVERANVWLAEQGGGVQVNLHTDSGKEYSHSFGIYGTARGEDESKRLAEWLAPTVRDALGTLELRTFERLGTTDYNKYIFYQYAKAPTCLLELCSHQTKRDMEALWGRAPLLAKVMASRLRDWFGVVAPDPRDVRIAELEVENAALKRDNGALRAAVNEASVALGRVR